MTENQHPIFELLDQDKRYKLEAYQFVRDALSFAQDVLGLGKSPPQEDPPPLESESLVEPHLTGQQLCEAVRQYSIEQFGYMAQMVLNNWGIRATGDVGEIVYNLIGIGLRDEKDISLNGLETVKKSDVVYLENYTSKLDCSVKDLEKLYGKKIILADRELVEQKAEEAILKNAQTKNVAFLVIGDVFGATTHVDLMLRAKN